MSNHKWKKFLPLFSLALLGLAAYFLVGIFEKVKWNEVLNYLQTLSWPFLGLLLAVTALVYSVLSFYDYISFRTLLKKSPPLKIVCPSAMISYAFNFNLGALLGGLGFRMRIYSGWGISSKIVPLAALLSVTTTWIGYIFVLSLTLLFGEVPPRAVDYLPSAATGALGSLGLGIIIIYLVGSAKEASMTIKGTKLILPETRFAFLQILLSSIQWCLASTILYLLLDHFGAKLSWDQVFFTYLLASIGGVVARIPAGVGVIEAIFLKVLPGPAPATMLAALLCFRAIYFLIPLALSLFGYLGIELIQKTYREKETFLPSRKSDHYA